VSPPVYYNDSEPFVCDWLENLIREKLLPAGVVDRRPIQEVEPADVRDFTQCHFFAGIGGWPLALQLAGWRDRPVWTGSCPCQPISGAGLQRGHADRRHLWPAFYRLIAECHPPVVFGEQVAKKLGREWFAAVRADLEGAGYACGAADLPAAGVGAPHQRHRLWWVADANGNRAMGDGRNYRHQERDSATTLQEQHHVVIGTHSASAHTGDLADANWGRREQCDPSERAIPESHASGGWTIEPGVGRVAHGLPNQVGALRGFGNAIVPQVAATFIQAYLECVA